MCGIAGIVGSSDPRHQLSVKEMTRSMALRGPDGEGFWFDPHRQKLLLARDRMGIKPLYYHLSKPGVFSFSSSLESLICNRDIELAVEMEALEYLLTLGYPPAPLTLYKDIYELPPAHFL